MMVGYLAQASIRGINLESCAREMARVNRPGGQVVMGNGIPGDTTLVAQILKISAAFTAPPLEGIRPSGQLGSRKMPGSVSKRQASSPITSRASVRPTGFATQVRLSNSFRPSATFTARR